MNTRELEQELEDLEKWLEDIRLEDIPLIVEGKKDVISLDHLEVHNTIILNRGETVVVFCEEIAKKYDKVIILTDWDRKGGHLARLLSEALHASGVHYDLEYRARVSKICKRETKDVEGLYHHYLRLQERLFENR